MRKLINIHSRCLAQFLYSKNTTQYKTLRLLTLPSQLHSRSDSEPSTPKLQEESINDEPENLQSPTMVPHQRVMEPQGLNGSSQPTPGFSGFSHPWPEWVDLMEIILVNKGYFDATGDPFRNWEVNHKSVNLVRTACLQFGRDRIDIIRSLSKKDIQDVVEFGCPSLDRKVINSGKRLRAYVGVNEANTCSSCSLRGACERAYVKAREEQGAKTVDVMRILLTFGLDSATGLVESKQCQNKTVEEAVIRLVKQIVKFCHENSDPTYLMKEDFWEEDHSRTRRYGLTKVMQQADWICPVCNFRNFAKNIKCLSCNALFQDKVRQITEGQEQLPLKKGDWICDECSFLNFAKNSKCLICQAKPSTRHLGPGEWACDSCHYINFRKNSACLRCDYKRPKASNVADPLIETTSSNLSYNRHELVPEMRRQEKNLEQAEYDASKFMSFPVLGGTSTISWSKEDIEEWKSEMRQGGRSLSIAADQEHKFGGSDFGSPKFLECSDDEGMEQWFQPKVESKRISSDSDESCT